MTPRPGFVPKRRPLSAIFIGGDPSTSSSGSPSSLPDLPEPPSPGAESIDSNASGLPSPPATNSTGSGGDEGSGSVRRRISVNKSGDSMASNRRMSRSSSPGDDEEGDDTARFAAHARRQSTQTTQDNAAALQRVMSLTQRNRMAMEKLSRLNSPSPSGRPARSPLPPLTGPPSSAASSSSSSSRASHAHAHSFPSSSPGLSGSETEREKYTYSSDELSATPPASISRSSTDPRERVLSLPTSPPRKSRTSSPGPSVASSTQRTPRKRVSLMSAPDSDVATAALAAVASMRRSPTLSAGRRSRQPLPREFFDGPDGGRASKEPSTPQKAAMRSLAGSPSPRKAQRESLQLSPHKLPQRTSSMTTSTTSKRHSSRWQSEDLNSTMYDDELTTTGRRQSARAGSGGMQGKLVGDSLRAAGIGMRGDDLFSSTSSSSHETSPDNVRERNGRSSSVLFDPRTPAHREYAHARPATSMADFGHVPQTAPPAARSHATQFIERNREGIGIGAQSAPRTASRASTSEMPPPPLRAPNFSERTYGSPRPRPREQISTPRPASAADEQSQEHLRLAGEALSLFDTQLSRLGDAGHGQLASTVVPDVFRDAQALVRFAEQLNGMLRTGTNRALERQIEAEVDDEGSGGGGEVDMVVLWQDVGADFRDCLRSSDELVRTMSNFLLGAGKLLKELKNQRDEGGGGHGRGYSLDSAPTPNGHQDARSSGAGSSQKSSSRTGSGSGVLDSSGRRSVDSRRSLDAARAERSSLDGIRSASRTEARRSLQLRENASTSSKSPEPIQPQRPSTLQPSSSMRRIITPRETENRTRVSALASPEYNDDVDPSPTPPARIERQPSDRLRGLAPLAIPKPLDTLPSEVESGARSAIRRVSSAIASTNRRKTSTTSNMTVRPQPAFAVPPTPGATTALTPATANSRHNTSNTAFPSSGGAGVSRHASDSNARTGTWRNVTFSRATAASVQRERKRTISATSGTSPAEVTDAHAYAATPVYTGRTAALRNGAAERASASDSERVRPATLSRRATGGVGLGGARASLDEERAPSRTLGRSERRRTLTEVFAPRA